MLDALEAYLDAGGRLMYLGGNGFYWVTSIDPTRPHVAEVRRGQSASRSWESAPGESHHSTTGVAGGGWRHFGRAPQRVCGIGFTALGGGTGVAYRREPGSFDPRASFIFEGVGDEPIGDAGLVLDAAAAYEVDRLDFRLGTPPHALLLASATGFPPFYQAAVEDTIEPHESVLLESAEARDRLVRADMVYFECPNDGAVFSTGSIAWSASLSHNGYDNPVSRITDNVLRRFAGD
jgi:N,N-dimethylformamidase